jgi:hypothetical protein
VEEALWTNLWRLPAPATVKNFVWKVGNELLSMKANLYKKHITPPICLQEFDDVFHILWSCKSSMAVWQECEKKFQKLAVGLGDGHYLLEFLMLKLEGEELLFALVLSRLIWLRRNDVVFGRHFTAPGRLVKEAIALVQEFQGATESLEVPKGLGANSVVKWVPPPCSYIKINWDTAINPGMTRTGVGVLIRDDKGELIAA